MRSPDTCPRPSCSAPDRSVVLEALCPGCGAPLHVHQPRLKHRDSVYSVIRHSLRGHVVVHHPLLSVREQSLLLDEIAAPFLQAGQGQVLGGHDAI